MADKKDFCEIECTNEDVVLKVSARKPPPRLLEEAESLFFVLSDKSRIQIVQAMKGGQEMCVCDVAAMLSTSVAAVSHHLRKMKDLGVLTNRSEGKLVYYSVRDKRVESLLDVVFAK